MAERSKALDWNSSKPRKGFRGFESHSLRHLQPTEASSRTDVAPLLEPRRSGITPGGARSYDPRLLSRAVAKRYKSSIRVNAPEGGPEGVRPVRAAESHSLCAVKGAISQWETDPPGNCRSAGSNRSGRGGNETAEAYDQRATLGGQRVRGPQRAVNAGQASKRIMRKPTYEER